MIGLIKTIFCYTMLCLSAFVQLPLLQYDSSLDGFTSYNYSLLYIVCFALSLVCRHNYAFIASLLYLVSGLCGLPVFAFGGGYQYIWEPSFGYLLGLLPLSVVAFYVRYHWDALGVKTFNNRSTLPLLGLVLGHLVGLAYLFIMRKFTVDNFMSMTAYQLLYDLFWGHLLIIFLPLKLNESEDL